VPDPPTFPIGPAIGPGDRKKFARAALASAPVAWWLKTAQNFTTAVQQIIAQWILDNVIDPIVGGVLFTVRSIISAILTAALGQDQAIGPPNFGAADIWLGIIPLLTEVGGWFDSVLGFIEEFNQALAELAATGGLAAPTIVTALYLLEVVGVVWVLWSINLVIYVPFISLNGLVQVLTAPVQGLLRRLR
jgi:hypothetical protein